MRDSIPLEQQTKQTEAQLTKKGTPLSFFFLFLFFLLYSTPFTIFCSVSKPLSSLSSFAFIHPPFLPSNRNSPIPLLHSFCFLIASASSWLSSFTFFVVLVPPSLHLFSPSLPHSLIPLPFLSSALHVVPEVSCLLFLHFPLPYLRSDYPLLQLKATILLPPFSQARSAV